MNTYIDVNILIGGMRPSNVGFNSSVSPEVQAIEVLNTQPGDQKKCAKRNLPKIDVLIPRFHKPPDGRNGG